MNKLCRTDAVTNHKNSISILTLSLFAETKDPMHIINYRHLFMHAWFLKFDQVPHAFSSGTILLH